MCTEEYVIGIDIGGTNIRFASMQRDGRICREEMFSSRNMDSDNPLKNLLEMAGQYISGAGRAPAAIGVGCPAVLDKSRRQILSAPNIGWLDGCMLADIMSGFLSVPVYLDKDAAMLLYYDIHVNHIENTGVIAGIYIGTGIGNAIFINGQPLAGAHGAAGELGHIPFPGRRDLCSCGLEGCMELYAGGKCLEKICRENYPETNISDIFSRHGNSQEVVRFVDNIACVAATEINILNPDALFLGGGVPAMRDFPSDLLKERILKRTRMTAGQQNILFSSRANPYNGAVGAALHAYRLYEERKN